MSPPPTWHAYLLRCADGTLYAGITNDLEKRLAAHNAGRGAKYTRGRGPVLLAWSEAQPSATAARRREAELKRLPRERKLALVDARVPPPQERLPGATAP